MWSVIAGLGIPLVVLAASLTIGLSRQRPHHPPLREREPGEPLGVRIEAAMRTRMRRP
jgi:hypothetical protein